MRRLLLVAALLVLPAVAYADGLPGTAAYPTYYVDGCTMQGAICYSATIYPANAGGYILGGSVTCSAPVISCWAPTLAVYDRDGNLIWHELGGAERTAQPEGAVIGIATTNYTPEVDPQGVWRATWPVHISTTPEPLTLVLLGTGLLALILVGRTRFA